MTESKTSEKICKSCNLPFFPSSNNQKNCLSCREKKELLKIQEKMLREIKGFVCINICDDCGEPFGASSPHQKWCLSCKKDRCQFEAKERKQKLVEDRPLRKVVCECGNEFETVSPHRIWCDNCAGIRNRKSKTVCKIINIPIDYKEDPELGKYIERQNRLAKKWSEIYIDSIGIEVDHNPNMSGAIYNG